MRWLFIFLLVLNVVYFGVELDRDTAIRHKQTGSVLPVPASAQRLQLIRELPEPPAPRTIDSGVDVAVATPVATDLPTDAELVTELPEIQLAEASTIIASYTCFRIGPVLDEEPINALQDWFDARNTPAQTHFIEEQGKQMFWIYLAPQPSRENAMAVLEEMQSKGIGDFRLINRGDLQNAISLGLFSSRDAVNTRLQELKEKGYVPVVVPYANVSKIYSLDVRINDATGLLTEMQNGYPARYESVQLDCNDINAGESGP